LKRIGEYSFALILFLFLINANLYIPVINLTFPVYDIIIVFLFFYFTASNSKKNTIYTLNCNYLKFISFSLAFISFLILASIIAGLLLYGDNILIKDLFSILIPIRLILFVIVGANLASMDYHYIVGNRRIVFFIILFGASYSIGISLLQYFYIIGFKIPIISEFSMSFIPERYYNFRIVGPSGNPNWNSFDLNLILVISFALFKSAVNRKSNKTFYTTLMIIIILLLVSLLFITLSRTGIITLLSLLFFLIYSMLRKTNIKNYIAVFLLMFFFYKIASILISENKEIVNKRIENTLKFEEAGQRAHLWSSRIENSSKRFPFGVGPSRNSLSDIVDSQFVLTYGDSGFFGVITYLLIICYLIIKPLFLMTNKIQPYQSILLYIVISLGMIMFFYSVTAEFMRNMRASSILLLLHSFFYYKFIVIRKTTYLKQYS